VSESIFQAQPRPNTSDILLAGVGTAATRAEGLSYNFNLEAIWGEIAATFSQKWGPNYTKFWEGIKPSSALPGLFQGSARPNCSVSIKRLGSKIEAIALIIPRIHVKLGEGWTKCFALILPLHRTYPLTNFDCCLVWEMKGRVSTSTAVIGLINVKRRYSGGLTS